MINKVDSCPQRAKSSELGHSGRELEPVVIALGPCVPLEGAAALNEGENEHSRSLVGGARLWSRDPRWRL